MRCSQLCPRCACVLLLMVCVAAPALAQGSHGDEPAPATTAAPADPPIHDLANAADAPTRPARPFVLPRETFLRASVSPRGFALNFVTDQKDIWTAPFHLRTRDLNWILPAAGLIAGSITADAEVSSRVNPTGTFASHASTISNAGLGAALAGPAFLYLWGRHSADAQKQETGMLSAEAAVDAFVVGESLKFGFRRERPGEGSGLGHFFSGSAMNSSFPSLHAMVSWSVAGVLAQEYPGPATKIFAYGTAAMVSFARVEAQKHFPSDVVVGSALGWYIGQQVLARHHDPELPSSALWGTFERGSPDEHADTENIASPYVPLDSWIYAAFDRLESLGLVSSGIQGMKPWTRRECARLLEEASPAVEDGEVAPQVAPEAVRLYRQLTREFAAEMAGPQPSYLSLDEVYVRSTAIGGPPLTDGYHFGQTMVNDFGRPYQRGWNSLAGFSASSSLGAFGFVVRGEYEHAPSAPGYSQPLLNAVLNADSKPLGQIAAPIAATNQFRLLDAYAMLNFKDFQFSFGKQSLWLGPTRDPFLISNNAEPMWMFRVSQTTPKQLPSFFSFLGPYRTEFFFGKLAGQHFVDTQDGSIAVSLGRRLAKQPMINGAKISFKPTPNFEFGVGRTGLFGGPRFPVTLGTFRRSFLSTTNAAGTGLDPGDRRSTADFTYRLPKLRDWLILYADAFVEDEISPIGYPRRSAHTGGLYAPQVPGIRKLDLRVEGGYTDIPGLLQPISQTCHCVQGGFFYWNTRYIDGYTNAGNIIGDATLGRQGIGYRGAATYWFAPNRTVALEYRSNEADADFLKGGNLRDVGLRSQWSFAHGTSVTGLLQYEWWNFPLLASGRQNNFTASVQFTYAPHWKLVAK
jgi:hypothetical protein